MCRIYGVTRAGYYAWRERRPARGAETDALVCAIRQAHTESRGTYGSPRIYRQLQRQGITAGENRIARLMRQHGLKGRVATHRYTSPAMKRFFGNLPNRQHDHPAAAMDQVWVGDITYLKVGPVYRYLAVVMDRCSRAVIGWSYGARKDVGLTLRALNRAIHNRRPAPGVIFHTDRGVEYAAKAFRQRLAQAGITQSMNRPGKVTDNAFIESFFHSMKAETIYGHRFDIDAEMLSALRSYIPFYNRSRIHSSLNYMSPREYEISIASNKGVN